jgi:hypothetical protein
MSYVLQIGARWRLDLANNLEGALRLHPHRLPDRA